MTPIIGSNMSKKAKKKKNTSKVSINWFFFFCLFSFLLIRLTDFCRHELNQNHLCERITFHNLMDLEWQKHAARAKSDKWREREREKNSLFFSSFGSTVVRICNYSFAVNIQSNKIIFLSPFLSGIAARAIFCLCFGGQQEKNK